MYRTAYTKYRELLLQLKLFAVSPDTSGFRREVLQTQGKQQREREQRTFSGELVRGRIAVRWNRNEAGVSSHFSLVQTELSCPSVSTKRSRRGAVDGIS